MTTKVEITRTVKNLYRTLYDNRKTPPPEEKDKTKVENEGLEDIPEIRTFEIGNAKYVFNKKAQGEDGTMVETII